MYKNPIPTVDAVVVLNNEGDIVLVKRKNPPYGYALPGGFVNYGESFEDAVVRELKEETGLDIENVNQFHTYSDPARDPRGHHVTTVFTATAAGQVPVAADDAAEVLVINIADAAERDDLAFDHKRIINEALYAMVQIALKDAGL